VRALLLLLCGGTIALGQQPSAKLSAHEQSLLIASGAVTWRGDIAPIVYKNCSSCHHAGGSAPFDLSTYAQAKRWSAQMLDVTQTRYMPPWLPAKGHGVFAGDRRMSDTEIAAIKAWVSAGAPEGGGKVPAAPVYKSTWELGPPDLVLEMPAAMQVPASGTDLYMNFVLPSALTKSRWVRAMQIQPGSAQVTHHASVIIDRTESLRRQHPSEWQHGISGMDIMVDSGDEFDPDSHFLFWKPDSTALVEAPGMPWRLDPGDDLVLNMHLKPTGKPETVRAKIGLYFTDKPATEHPMLLQLENDAALDISPGAKDFVVDDQLTLPVAVEVLGVYPHAHYLGKRLEGWATLPNGARQDLVLIESWDIDRQSVYRLAKPLPLPAGTVVHMRYSYDNSAANVHNPHTPPVRVKAGNRSEDEMAHLWLQVLPQKPASGEPDPRLALERAWMENRLRKSPNDDIALYNMAALETAEGQNAQAEAIYRKLLAMRPGDVRTMTSLGAAMAASGNWQGARQEFREAIAKDANYTDAVFDLASLDVEHDAAAEAEPLLVKLTASHPEDGAAQRLLAVVYANQGLLAKALDRLKAWQAAAPADPEPHRALAQVYAQMGQLPDAVREQKTVTALAPKSASDWSDLGVMEAEGGNAVAAKKDFAKALELDPTLEAAKANLGKLP
jgi:Flp pilus assembly protein TadD